MNMQSKSTVEEISPTKKKLCVTIDNGVLQNETNQAYHQLGNRVTLKGFRQGKAPRHVLEQYYAPTVEQEVLEKVLTKSYDQAVKEHQLEPISTPQITLVSPFSLSEDLSYVAQFEIKPQIQKLKWKGLALKLPTYVMPEDALTQTLQQIQEKNSLLIPITTRDIMQEGDFVACNITGFLEGKPALELTHSHRAIQLGKGTYFAACEEALIGQRIHETYTIEFDIPVNETLPHLAGKQARVEITPQSLKALQKPKLDDEFAKDISEKFETLEDLKADILKNLEQTKKEMEYKQWHAVAKAALIEANPFDIPSSMIERQIEFMLNSFFQQVPRDQEKEMRKRFQDQLKVETREDAEETVRSHLLCDALIRELNLSITQAQMEEELEHEAQRLAVSPAQLRAHYKPADLDYLRVKRMTQIALDILIEQAQITTKETLFLGEK